MRITPNILINNLLNNLYKNTERMGKLQNQIASGKRLTKPSDDPGGVLRSLFLRTTLGELDQFEKNVDDSKSWLSVTQNALNELVSVFRQAKTIAIQGSNDPSSDVRSALSYQVGGLIETALNAGNTAYDGKYIFAGSKTQDLPFTSLVEGITYRGDRSKMTREVALSQTVITNLHGDEVFQPELYHQVVAGVRVSDITAPLNEVLPASAVGAGNFTINLAGVAPLVIGPIDPTVDSLTDLMNSINAAFAASNSPAEAEIVDNRLVITSTLQGTEGVMTITDGVAGGILTRLGIADNDGKILGENILPPAEKGVFDTLIDLRNALEGRALAENKLMGLSDGSQSVGLIPSDLITFTATTTLGAIADLQITVDTETTLSELAQAIQDRLRTDPNGTTTALVTIKGGQLIITNPAGNGAQNITAIALTATASDLVTPRSVFNSIMSSLSLVNAGGSPANATSSQTIICTDEISLNISNCLDEISKNEERFLKFSAQGGAKIDRMELDKNRIADTRVDFEGLLSQTEDVDMAKAILEFQNQQNIYQAALASGARIIQMSLVDFLR